MGFWIGRRVVSFGIGREGNWKRTDVPGLLKGELALRLLGEIEFWSAAVGNRIFGSKDPQRV
jgi:hypothetical protein